MNGAASCRTKKLSAIDPDEFHAFSATCCSVTTVIVPSWAFPGRCDDVRSIQKRRRMAGWPPSHLPHNPRGQLREKSSDLQLQLPRFQNGFRLTAVLSDSPRSMSPTRIYYKYEYSSVCLPSCVPCPLWFDQR